jgi:hypothetical protein
LCVVAALIALVGQPPNVRPLAMDDPAVIDAAIDDTTSSQRTRRVTFASASKLDDRPRARKKAPAAASAEGKQSSTVTAVDVEDAVAEAVKEDFVVPEDAQGSAQANAKANTQVRAAAAARSDLDAGAAAAALEDASAVVYEHAVRTSSLLVMPPKPEAAVHRALSNRFVEFWCKRASPLLQLRVAFHGTSERAACQILKSGFRLGADDRRVHLSPTLLEATKYVRWCKASGRLERRGYVIAAAVLVEQSSVAGGERTSVAGSERTSASGGVAGGERTSVAGGVAEAATSVAGGAEYGDAADGDVAQTGVGYEERRATEELLLSDQSATLSMSDVRCVVPLAMLTVVAQPPADAPADEKASFETQSQLLRSKFAPPPRRFPSRDANAQRRAESWAEQSALRAHLPVARMDVAAVRAAAAKRKANDEAEAARREQLATRAAEARAESQRKSRLMARAKAALEALAERELLGRVLNAFRAQASERRARRVAAAAASATAGAKSASGAAAAKGGAQPQSALSAEMVSKWAGESVQRDRSGRIVPQQRDWDAEKERREALARGVAKRAEAARQREEEERAERAEKAAARQAAARERLHAAAAPADERGTLRGRAADDPSTSRTRSSDARQQRLSELGFEPSHGAAACHAGAAAAGAADGAPGSRGRDARASNLPAEVLQYICSHVMEAAEAGGAASAAGLSDEQLRDLAAAWQGANAKQRQASLQMVQRGVPKPLPRAAAAAEPSAASRAPRERREKLNVYQAGEKAPRGQSSELCAIQ